jgi:hypothetical protein
MKARWWINILGAASLAGGFYLLYLSISRALQGDAGAWWVLGAFGFIVAVLYLFVRRFWTLVLDDRDALDVFKEAAAELGGTLTHFRKEHKTTDGSITEKGYRIRVHADSTDVNLALVHIGKTHPASRVLQQEHDLLVMSMPTTVSLEMAVVNPGAEIRESVDVERYAPIVLESKQYFYFRHALVFTPIERAAIAEVFENLFIQNLLAEVFYHHRFKLITWSGQVVQAFKSVMLESLPQDMEAFKLLVNLKELIEEHLKRQSTELLKGV